MKRAIAVTTGTAGRCLALAVGAFIGLSFSLAVAQNQQLEEKIMAIKQAQALNKQKLSQYTWQETETISIKGNVKDTKIYQVQLGPDGKPQKTEISNEKAQSGGGRQGRVRQRVVEKKTEEYQQYGHEIGALAKQYTTPNPDALMQARQQGNISLQSGQGSTINLVIRNYVKPNDSVTMTIDGQTKSLVRLNVSSYLNDPKDAVTISAKFARLADGTNHVANTTINGVSKQLTVNDQNSNYQMR
ncbi:MAG TPA: hypothetical protein VL240_04280 [Candidatus Binatia bacterium]|nr:hypothetical protein [Candidatus Binatia bacterium]